MGLKIFDVEAYQRDPEGYMAPIRAEMRRRAAEAEERERLAREAGPRLRIFDADEWLREHGRAEDTAVVAQEPKCGKCSKGETQDRSFASAAGPSRAASWRTAIEAFAARGLTRHGEALVEAALAFLTSPFAGRALALGWSELEVFGVHRIALPRRYDAMGLAAGLAWSVIGARLVAMSRDAAGIAVRTGAHLTHRRAPTCGPGEVVVFWRCQALLEDPKQPETTRNKEMQHEQSRRDRARPLCIWPRSASGKERHACTAI